VKAERKGKRVKAVIDTNVLVSGLFAEAGAVAELIALSVEERFELVTSEEILSELHRVLHKPTIREHFKPSEDDIIEYIKILREKAIITADRYRTGRIKKDATDDKFLACALEAVADCIVSGDRHLLEIKSYQGIQIVDARTFLKRMKVEKGPFALPRCGGEGVRERELFTCLRSSPSSPPDTSRNRWTQCFCSRAVVVRAIP
jgi:uncharacterized protein